MEQRVSPVTDKEAPAAQPVNLTDSLGAFLGALDRAFPLLNARRGAIRQDFMRGIDLLLARGMPLCEALRLLNPKRLHGFYAQTRQTFYSLDNGAKQYPLTMLDGRMAMFRLCAVLDAPVEPVLLQLALTFVLRRFPHYATRLCRGVFWYYLRPCATRYAVMADRGAVCKAMDVSGEIQPLFRVLYKDNCVSVELFHILADGMGGMMFLKSLLAEYYRLQGEDAESGDAQVLDTAAPSLAEDVENGFIRFCGRNRGDRLIGRPAVRIPARHLPAGECRVEQFTLPAAELRGAAHHRGVSVTALMSAVILVACQSTAQAQTGRYRLQVTVDLRRRFQSRTLRNFSWFGALEVDAAGALCETALLETLSAQLKSMTSRDALERNVSSAQRMIRRLTYMPLQWKTLLLRTAYRMTGDFFFTATLSNLGEIPLRGPLQAHVREIGAVLGPSPGNPYSFALATARDTSAAERYPYLGRPHHAVPAC